MDPDAGRAYEKERRAALERRQEGMQQLVDQTQELGAYEVVLPPKPHTTYNGYSDGSEPLWTAEQMDDYARAAIAHAAEICEGVAAKSKNSLFRSGAKVCAGEIRAGQGAADHTDSEVATTIERKQDRRRVVSSHMTQPRHE
jgi:hypothetical protein